MSHVIKTFIIDVLIGKKEDAFGVQQQLRDHFYSSVLPRIEKMFNELAGNDRMISLERIEIDLGNISMSDISGSEAASELESKIYRQLKDVLMIQKEKIKQEPLSFNICQQWIYYMKNGHLPWNGLSTTAEWYEKVLEGFAVDQKSIDLLRSLIRDNARAVRRIVNLHSGIYLSHLAEVLTAKNKSDLYLQVESIFNLLQENVRSKTETRFLNRTRKTVWGNILLLLAQPVIMPDLEIIERSLLPELSGEALLTLKRSLTAVQGDQALQQLIQKRAEMQMQGAIQPKAPEVSEKDEVPKIKIPEEGIFVNNAGVVLLHPFLKQLFTRVGVIRNDNFPDEGAQQKALLLLHYLVTGKEEFEEHELVVNKILCSYVVENPVEAVELGDEDKAECTALLLSVIGQWSILKNTSADGLRENFLKRPGKIYTRNGSKYLVVESGPIDMLLDHLPWGVSIIKLPWMEEILRVEWR